MARKTRRPRTDKAMDRQSVRSILYWIDAKERDAKFWFNQRHRWICFDENGNAIEGESAAAEAHKHCRQKFLAARGQIKLFRKLLVGASKRLVQSYKN